MRGERGARIWPCCPIHPRTPPPVPTAQPHRAVPAAGGEGKSLRLPHVCAGAGTVGRKQLWGWDPPRFPFSPLLGAGGGMSGAVPMLGVLSISRPSANWTWRALSSARPKGRAGLWHRSPAPGVSLGLWRGMGGGGGGGVAGWEGGAEPISQSCAVSPPALPEVTPGSSAHCSFVCCFSSVHGRRAPGVMGGGVHLGYFSTS